MSTYCLTTAYMAPVAYYSVLAKDDMFVIEQYDSYIKQSYRNRCRIAGANGIVDLSIPIEKPKSEKKLTKDIKISEHLSWQKQHWRAIESAYNSSPFFEYYKDDFIPFYEKKWTFLLDFNQALLEMILELLALQTNIKLSRKYLLCEQGAVIDLREEIHPKREINPLLFKPYYQVFAQKFGFLPNLSIVDLLFNMGNESILLLEEQSDLFRNLNYKL